MLEHCVPAPRKTALTVQTLISELPRLGWVPMEIVKKLYRTVMGYLPGSIAGRIDLLRPSTRSGWGGPLNGQDHRRSMVRELATRYTFQRVVETGTFRGTGAEFFAAVFGVPVTTIE